MKVIFFLETVAKDYCIFMQFTNDYIKVYRIIHVVKQTQL